MSLPCPQVLEEIFDLYQNIRNPVHNSYLGLLKYGFEKVYSLLNNKKTEPAVEKIEHIRKEIISTIELIKVKDDNSKFDMWMNLIFTLGNRAKEAQDLKYFADESLFCETLHAMRSYIIHSINADEVYKKHFKQYLQALQLETEKIHEDLVIAVRDDSGRNADELFAKYSENILKLAFLEDKNAIIVARKSNLLGYLNVYPHEKLVNEYKLHAAVANSFIPFCLQTDFIGMLYSQIFQKVTTIAFDDFEKNAAKKANTSERKSIQHSHGLEATNNVLAEYNTSYRTLHKKLSASEIKVEEKKEEKQERVLCPQIFINYFHIYDLTRSADRESTTGKAKVVAERISGVVTGKETTIAEIEKIKLFICSEVQEIESTEEEEEKFVLWFKLIFTLGKKAEEVQKSKYNPDTESLFCRTLHALRSYLVYSLSKDPIYSEWFMREIEALQADAKDWDKKLHKDVYQNNGLEANTYLANHQECILKLALLENKEAIIEARKNNLFTYLKHYQRKELTSKELNVESHVANPFIPYCLHAEFFRILYGAEYQRNKIITFDNFASDAKREYEAENDLLALPPQQIESSDAQFKEQEQEKEGSKKMETKIVEDLTTVEDMEESEMEQETNDKVSISKNSIFSVVPNSTSESSPQIEQEKLYNTP